MALDLDNYPPVVVWADADGETFFTANNKKVSAFQLAVAYNELREHCESENTE